MANSTERIVKMVGIGADNSDGHIRVTKGSHYHLLQGSDHSHAKMQEWCEEINKRLVALNREMHDLSVDEFMDLARDAAPKP